MRSGVQSYIEHHTSLAPNAGSVEIMVSNKRPITSMWTDLELHMQLSGGGARRFWFAMWRKHPVSMAWPLVWTHHIRNNRSEVCPFSLIRQDRIIRMPALRLGWIGLGSMGLHMAQNLQKYLQSTGGPGLLYTNRTLSRGADLEAMGGIPKDSVAQVVQNSDVIFSCVGLWICPNSWHELIQNCR